MTTTIVTTNPATGAQLATYAAMSPQQIDDALDAAAAAQRIWASTDFKQRGDVLRAAAETLRQRDNESAQF